MLAHRMVVVRAASTRTPHRGTGEEGEETHTCSSSAPRGKERWLCVRVCVVRGAGMELAE